MTHTRLTATAASWEEHTFNLSVLRDRIRLTVWLMRSGNPRFHTQARKHGGSSRFFKVTFWSDESSALFSLWLCEHKRYQSVPGCTDLQSGLQMKHRSPLFISPLQSESRRPRVAALCGLVYFAEIPSFSSCRPTHTMRFLGAHSHTGF